MQATSLDTTEQITKALEYLRSKLGGRENVAGVDLALALNWSADRLQERTIDAGKEPLSITRVNSGGQGVAVFACSANRPTHHLVEQGALYAYHASIEWGLVANSEELTVFNSHWLKSHGWFELPSVRWANIESGLDILEGITPAGMQVGLIERIAARFAPADEILLPVDDELVARLDFWRSEMARFVASSVGIDETIHRLFAQFFVLRAVEDRGLAPGMISLHASLRESGYAVDMNTLALAFDFASQHLQTELFSKTTVQQVPSEVLAGVINDLYKPRNLPYVNARYNFAWIDADVLGRAYEKYLSRVLQPSSAPYQLNLLRTTQPKREIDSVRNKRSAGIYYTPTYLVSFLAQQAIDSFLEKFPGALPRIVDPTCGSGSFLTGAAAYLAERMRAQSNKLVWTRELVSQKLICGIDSDPRAVLLAKLSLWLKLTEEPNALPLPALDEVIISGDSLDDATWTSLGTQFDIVLGNPPFVPTGTLGHRAELETRFRSARGRFDYAYLFVEQSLKYLRDGGTIGMVLPNRMFRNRDASTIREVLTKESSVNVIVDFGSNEVFRGVSAYIGLLVVTKRGQAESHSPVRVIHVSRMAPRLMNLILSSGANRDVKNDFVESFARAALPIDGGPWLLLSPSVQSARLRLEENSVQLSELAETFQGVKVGANDIFIVSVLSDAQLPVAQIRNGLGEDAPIETDLLHPVSFGTNIEAYSRVSGGLWLVYPYREGKLISEAELVERYPLALRYFGSYKFLLDARVSIKESGRQWYELVRHRDQGKLERPKLLMRDLAITTAFALDEFGQSYLVGGTAVVPEDPSLLKPLLAYLNSSLVNWYLAPTTPSFRGSFQKFEPQHISNIPVLEGVVNDMLLRDQLSDWVDQAIEAKAGNKLARFEGIIAAIDRRLSNIVGIDTNA